MILYPLFLLSRRTRASTTMRILSTLLVTSTAMTLATAVSTAIPTGEFSSIVYSKLFRNYWWLRSPVTHISDINAYYVMSDGVVTHYYDIAYSYGRLTRQNIPKFYKMVVKIAEHVHVQLQLRLCVVCEVGWYSRLRQCRQLLFLRAPAIVVFIHVL